MIYIIAKKKGQEGSYVLKENGLWHLYDRVNLLIDKKDDIIEIKITDQLLPFTYYMPYKFKDQEEFKKIVMR